MDDLFNEYLKTMNETMVKKIEMLKHITPNLAKSSRGILDVGVGGGGLLDQLEILYPNKQIYGIDLSTDIIGMLRQKKLQDNHSWIVQQGNAMNIADYFKKGKIDVICFSSVLHEVFSYTGFNYNSLRQTLKGAFDILPIGGKILIRDGIMSETNDLRIFRFKNEKDIDFLKKYAKDFKGRKIRYNTRKLYIFMRENDAMEFLYTYTWGEEHYEREVQEQFGYFTPSRYVEEIKEIMGEKNVHIEIKSFLQGGYAEALKDKVYFMNGVVEAVPLPNNTCIIGITKIGG